MNRPPPKVCLVEDDPIMGESLRERLTLEGYQADWHQLGKEALSAIGADHYAAVISDIRLPDIDGADLYRSVLEHLRGKAPPTIFITGYGSIDSAVELLKLGAADYFTKPLDIKKLMDRLRDVCGRHRSPAKAPTGLLGVSTAMRDLEEQLPQLARHYETAVLITGESGVGKEVVARKLHELQRSSGHFIAVNCAAVAESLAEAELFGHERGAFTGAAKSRKGVFEQAMNGTLFLDEIGDMPLPMQAKLLRAIQEHSITRVGGTGLVPVHTRVICATHRDLHKEVERGTFREDLYYRINVITVHIPPLRERREDILWLADRFLSDHADRFPDERKALSGPARAQLLQYDWPGNVRELKHAIERACILTPDALIHSLDLDAVRSRKQPEAQSGELRPYVQATEREHIIEVLRRHDGSIQSTAHELGISRKTLWQKMKRLDIPKDIA
jgi:two-component system response regulator AtoC